MNKEELININGIREDLYQAMQIGDITLSSKDSQKLVDFMNYQDKEIERLNKELEEKEAILGGIQQLEAEIERLKKENSRLRKKIKELKEEMK